MTNEEVLNLQGLLNLTVTALEELDDFVEIIGELLLVLFAAMAQLVNALLLLLENFLEFWSLWCADLIIELARKAKLGIVLSRAFLLDVVVDSVYVKAEDTGSLQDVLLNLGFGLLTAIGLVLVDEQ